MNGPVPDAKVNHEDRCRRGIRVWEVPLEHIADAVTSRTTLVAVSAVQSADGRVADLDALHAASRATGRTLVLGGVGRKQWAVRP